MPAHDLRHRARLLFVVLSARALRPAPAMLVEWLDCWSGLGLVTAGMARQGFDLQLTRYGEEGWRATFYPAGREHAPTRAIGSAWAPAPWLAVQQAAWTVLRKADVT